MSIEAAFTHFPVLTTSRLQIRQLRATDAEAIFAIRSDPAVTESYGRNPQQAIAESQAMIQRIQANYERGESLFWGVTFREEETVIGTCLLWNFDLESLHAELGYELGRAYWRQDIMLEAVSALLTYGFTELGLHRIEAFVGGNNTSSSGLLRKLGFTQEGRLRQRIFFQNRFEDELHFGLLKDEWHPKS